MNALDLVAQWCTTCQEIVKLGHWSAEHKGDHSVDVIPIAGKEDGQWIAQPDDMGHYSPHMWMEIDGQEMCAECGGVKIPPEAVEQWDSRKEDLGDSDG